MYSCAPLLLLGLLQTTPILDLESPDGRNLLQIWLDAAGRPLYAIQRDGNTLLEPSALGFRLDGERNLSTGFTGIAVAKGVRNESWMQPWGEVAQVQDHCATGEVELKQEGSGRRLLLYFRAYNDGLAFRYEIPAQAALGGELRIMEEITEFRFAEDLRSWWTPAYWWNRYEYLTQSTSLSEIDTAHTPVTLQGRDGTALALHEAALTDFASMALRRTEERCLQADLVPWSDGVRVRAALPMRSPWRVIQVAEHPAELLESTLTLNLNEPSRIADTSWIRPAKYTGIWWEMHLGTATWGSGPTHGATTARTKRVIDFAAKHGLDGVLVEGWNTGWDGDWVANGEIFNFTQAHPEFDMAEVSRYARDRKVELIGHHETGASILNYEAQLEQALDFYVRHGVRYIKTGYVGHGQSIKRRDDDGNVQLEWHHGQHMVRHYRRVTEEAAKRGIMLCVHEPIHDTGIRRTWPNLLSREGARGQEFNAWGQEHGNPPDHTVLLAYTRMLSGPMDYTPGVFELLFEEARPDNRVNSTLAHQLALYVVLYSPVQMLPDLPENYEARPGAFRFLLDVPVDWRRTLGLAGEIGEYIVVARQDRNSSAWFVGAITNERERELELDLSFLDAGRSWRAEIYRDGEGADWQKNPYAFLRETRSVMVGETMKLWLASGGGAALRFVAPE